MAAPGAESEAQTELTRLDRTPSAREYLRELWSRREFALVVPVGSLRAKNMDTVLGNLWHLLNPLLMMGVYFLLFGVILDVSRGVDNFLTFLGIGVFVFHYTQRSVISGATSIVSNEGLIRSIRFPRAVLPISSVIEQTLAFLPAVIVMVAVALATGERPGWTWFLLVPVFAIQASFNLGAAFFAARITDMFRDFANLLPFIFRMLFYLSGALYPVQRFIREPLHQRLFELNPMFEFLTLARGAIFGSPTTMKLWFYALAWALVVLVGGFMFFRAAEQRYGGT